MTAYAYPAQQNNVLVAGSPFADAQLQSAFPVITLQGSNPMTIQLGSTFTEPGFIATDDVDGVITQNVSVTGSVNSAVAGAYTLTYSVTDSDSNTTSVERIVNVVNLDTTRPVITLFGDNPLVIEQGSTFTEPGYSATDNVDGVITQNVNVTGSVNTSTVGNYVLTYSVTDSAGNTGVETRTVQVVAADTIAPVITLNGGSTVTLLQGTPYVEPGYSAIDNVDGNITGSVTVTGSVDENTLGNYTLTYSVTDSNNNLASVQRVVVVVEDDFIARFKIKFPEFVDYDSDMLNLTLEEVKTYISESVFRSRYELALMYLLAHYSLIYSSSANGENSPSAGLVSGSADGVSFTYDTMKPTSQEEQFYMGSCYGQRFLIIRRTCIPPVLTI